MITVRKTNILVIPITEQHNKTLVLDNESFKRKVDSRLNAGKVISVSKHVDGVLVGDIVGYSTLDGVNVSHNNIDYILLSEREVQAKILCENVERVKFKDHRRDDVHDYIWRNELVKNDLVKLL